MNKRYFRRLRDEMADAERLVICSHPAYGRFGFRCWPEGGPSTRRVFIAGLARAERQARVPVYGILLSRAPDGAQADEQSIGLSDTVRVWRARDGMFLGEVLPERLFAPILFDLGLTAPV